MISVDGGSFLSKENREKSDMYTRTWMNRSVNRSFRVMNFLVQTLINRGGQERGSTKSTVVALSWFGSVVLAKSWSKLMKPWIRIRTSMHFIHGLTQELIENEKKKQSNWTEVQISRSTWEGRLDIRTEKKNMLDLLNSTLVENKCFALAAT